MSDNAPERIWAQLDGYDPEDPYPNDLLTWEPRQFYGDDVEFVRKDIHDAVVAERDAALARVKALEAALLKEIAHGEGCDTTTLGAACDVPCFVLPGESCFCRNRQRAILDDLAKPEGAENE